MPMDWHPRTKVLSSKTIACKNLDLLINRSHTDSFFTPTTTTNLLRDPPSQIVSLLKKITMGSHHLIRCAFPDKERKKKKEIRHAEGSSYLLSSHLGIKHLLYTYNMWLCENAPCLYTNLHAWQMRQTSLMDRAE